MASTMIGGHGSAVGVVVAQRNGLTNCLLLLDDTNGL